MLIANAAIGEIFIAAETVGVIGAIAQHDAQILGSAVPLSGQQGALVMQVGEARISVVAETLTLPSVKAIKANSTKTRLIILPNGSAYSPCVSSVTPQRDLKNIGAPSSDGVQRVMRRA